MADDKQKIWSGFWPRFFSWFIDLIVLGVVCGIVGWVGIDYVSTWGANGRLFGLILGTLYFGVTTSGLGDGRTVGMRACGLKVTGLDGKPLGVVRAIGRALFLVGPIMLNNWYSQTGDTGILTHVLDVALSVVVFGGLLAQTYLFLFNLPTRRMVHDLIFRSIVVKVDVKDFKVPQGRVHAFVAVVLGLVVLGAMVALPSILNAWMPNMITASTSLTPVQNAVGALPEISETSVLDNTSTFMDNSGSQTARTLIVTARVRTMPANVDRELARIGAATVKSYRFAPNQRLLVRIIYGFDLGFAAYSTSNGKLYSTQCTTADEKCLLN